MAADDVLTTAQVMPPLSILTSNCRVYASRAVPFALIAGRMPLTIVPSELTFHIAF